MELISDVDFLQFQINPWYEKIMAGTIYIVNADDNFVPHDLSFE